MSACYNPSMFWTLITALALADTCALWGEASPAEPVRGGLIAESSGLAASRVHPGVIYTHDDRNGPRELSSYTVDGKFLHQHNVRGGSNEDWEGIEAAPCPDRGDCIYIGDIGDNDEVRDEIRVYIAREPDRDDGALKVIETRKAVWPGSPRDSEALLVHPCSGDIYVISKSASALVAVHRFPDEQKGTLIEVAQLQLDGDSPFLDGSFKITGGSFDADGDRVVLRSERNVWEWVVDPDDPEAHWAEVPEPLTIALDDSEAITYTLDGDLISSSEGSPMTLSTMLCEDLLPAAGECRFDYQPGCRCDSSKTIPAPSGFLLLYFMLYSRRSVDV